MTVKTKGVLNGFLDRGARFEGTLSFDDVFRIDGSLKGIVISEQELVIGDAGVVEGEIRVGRLAVSGTIRGVIHARERLEVHAGAKVYAEIHTPTLTVEEGATIQGPVETGPQLVSARPAEVKPEVQLKEAKRAS